VANKKEINQKSCIRLRELISDLKMTQSQFGELLGLGARQISCMVNGTRRLTEENARRLARLFPEVRYEWLMGYDDYKTEDEYRTSILNSKVEGMWRNEYIEIEEFVRTVVSALGYKFSSVLWEYEDAIEESTPEFEKDFLNLRKLFNKDNEILQKIFDPNELLKIRQRLNAYNVEFADLWDTEEDQYIPMLKSQCGGETDEEYENRRKTYYEKMEVVEKNNKECAENWKRLLEEREQEEYYYSDLCDSSGNVLVEFTPRESNIFAHELYDVIHALVAYHINKNKKSRR